MDLGEANHLRIRTFLPPSFRTITLVFLRLQVEGNDKVCYILIFMKSAIMYFYHYYPESQVGSMVLHFLPLQLKNITFSSTFGKDISSTAGDY